MKPDDPTETTERSRNLWAPWRMEYIDSLTEPDEDDGCFLCRYRDNPQRDETNLVLWRGRETLVVMNRFPYAGGHTLIAPREHVDSMEQCSDAVLLEMMHMVRDVQTVVFETIRPQGFNVGINVGRCAGAGLPGHLHIHVVPRWPGDTNFITVFGGVRVIPTTLGNLYCQLRRTGERLELPTAATGEALQE